MHIFYVLLNYVLSFIFKKTFFFGVLRAQIAYLIILVGVAWSGYLLWAWLVCGVAWFCWKLWRSFTICPGSGEFGFDPVTERWQGLLWAILIPVTLWFFIENISLFCKGMGWVKVEMPN